MRVFTSLLTPDEARARYWAQLRLAPVGTEVVPLLGALERVLGRDVVAAETLPPFDRSTVDGYAVRAADVAAASGATPVELRPAGEVLMGQAAEVAVGPGAAARVPTGGALPDGADAVVMQEDVDTSGGRLRVRRAVGPGENVLARGEDVRAGEVVLRAGRRLRPQDLGILAGLGITAVAVRVPPRVALFGTGNEIVPPDAQPAPGQVRDMNGVALAGQVAALGGEPVLHPILPDDYDRVLGALRAALPHHDLVLVSGGSSVGERDVVVDAINALGPPGIIVHGIAIKPGKPTVLALAGTRPVIGLPGNPVSAMVIFDVFVRPVIEALLGLPPSAARRRTVQARATARITAPPEREDHVRVRLIDRAGEVWAEPLPGKSGLLTSLVRADGIVVVKSGTAAAEGEVLEVELLA